MPQVFVALTRGLCADLSKCVSLSDQQSNGLACPPRIWYLASSDAVDALVYTAFRKATILKSGRRTLRATLTNPYKYNHGSNTLHQAFQFPEDTVISKYFEDESNGAWPEEVLDSAFQVGKNLVVVSMEMPDCQLRGGLWSREFLQDGRVFFKYTGPGEMFGPTPNDSCVWEVGYEVGEIDDSEASKRRKTTTEPAPPPTDAGTEKVEATYWSAVSTDFYDDQELPLRLSPMCFDSMLNSIPLFPSAKAAVPVPF